MRRVQAMELIGQSGDSFLIGVSEGMYGEYGPFPLGRIYDRRARRLSDVMPIDSILAHAPWFAVGVPPTLPDGQYEHIVREVEELSRRRG